MGCRITLYRQIRNLYKILGSSFNKFLLSGLGFEPILLYESQLAEFIQ